MKRKMKKAKETENLKDFLTDWWFNFGDSAMVTEDLIELAEDFGRIGIGITDKKEFMRSNLSRWLGVNSNTLFFGKYTILPVKDAVGGKRKWWKLHRKEDKLTIKKDYNPLAEAKDHFFDMLDAHLRIVGGRGLSKNMLDMKLREFIDHIYPNDLRLQVVNLRMKEEYQR